MTKKLMIKLIKIYQIMPLSSHNNCKYIPTCSNYGIEAIEEYGALKGGLMMIGRIIRCNPWSKGGIDPVKKKSDF